MSSSTSVASYVMIKLDGDYTLADYTAQGNMEKPYTTWKICSTVGDGTRTTLWNRFSAKKFLGISHPLSADELRGNAASSPTEGAYYHLIASGLPTTADGPSVVALVEIWYTAVFTEPKDLASS